MKERNDVLRTLFKTMFTLSAVTFGGGFVIVSLLKKKFVEELGWLEEDEMLDITAITQSSPGPLPVNASVIIGYRMAGVIGSVVAVLATILPPMIIISVIAVFYNEFRSNQVIALALLVMRAGVAAVILDVTLTLCKGIVATKRTLYIIMMIIAFIARVVFHISAVAIIASCLFVGFLDIYNDRKKENNVTL